MSGRTEIRRLGRIGIKGGENYEYRKNSCGVYADLRVVKKTDINNATTEDESNSYSDK